MNSNDSKYIMIRSSQKEKDEYEEAALADGFKWVSTWFRWIAKQRVKQVKKGR